MNAKVSSWINPFSIIICVVVAAGATLIGGDSVNPNILSHQPVTFGQMEKLVTPQDPAVTQTLRAALGESYISSAGNLTSAVVVNRIRIWVCANVTQTSDYSLHSVDDYWQTASETLTEKTGDCEDYAILMVSLLRAYGAPEDQIYAAIGYDLDNNWNAIVLDRYSYGAWVAFDPQTLDGAVPLGSVSPSPYHISYCFNDQNGFYGIPGYPKGYDVTTVSIVPVNPMYSNRISITSLDSNNQSLNDAKQALGELWLPAYLPPGYDFTYGFAYAYYNTHNLALNYQSGVDHYLGVSETNTTGTVPESIFQSGTFEQITVNGQPAYFGVFSYTDAGNNPPLTKTILVLRFAKGEIRISLFVMPPDSLTREELIKVDESFFAY